MAPQYISRKERNAVIISGVKLALQSFERQDYEDHTEAIRLLVNIDEHEIADALHKRWNTAHEEDVERGRTLQTAYAQAQGYERH